MSADMEFVNDQISYAQAECEPEAWWETQEYRGQRYSIGTTWSQIAIMANLNYTVSMVELNGPLNGGQVPSGDFRPVRQWQGGSQDGRQEFIGKPRSDEYQAVAPYQMADVAEAVKQIMPGAYIANAGAVSNGNRQFLSVRLGECGPTVDGVRDMTNLYLTIGNAHDGTTPLHLRNGSFRVVCRNTYLAQLSAIRAIRAQVNAEKGKSNRGDFINGKAIMLRHTGDMDAKLEAAKQAIAAELGWAEAYETYAQSLVETPMNDRQFSDMLSKILEPNVTELSSKKAVTQKMNAYATTSTLLVNEWEKEKARGNASAWGALNAVTWFTSFHSVKTGKALGSDVVLDTAIFQDSPAAQDGRKLVTEVNDFLATLPARKLITV